MKKKFIVPFFIMSTIVIASFLLFFDRRSSGDNKKNDEIIIIKTPLNRERQVDPNCSSFFPLAVGSYWHYRIDDEDHGTYYLRRQVSEKLTDGRYVLNSRAYYLLSSPGEDRDDTPTYDHVSPDQTMVVDDLLQCSDQSVFWLELSFPMIGLTYNANGIYLPKDLLTRQNPWFIEYSLKGTKYKRSVVCSKIKKDKIKEKSVVYIKCRSEYNMSDDNVSSIFLPIESEIAFMEGVGIYTVTAILPKQDSDDMSMEKIVYQLQDYYIP
ncbi:MAG: hypothetical protein NZM04_06140 [Methylacidiphilales bacterium]|nr:hypothetical protein [Candidatus Methylacidiphilales bacterium]